MAAHSNRACAAGVVPSPFDFADVVTTTTHKSLRGPRGAMIFFRKGLRKTDKKGNQIMYDMEQKINFSVFPGLQARPLANQAVLLTPREFRAALPRAIRSCRHKAEDQFLSVPGAAGAARCQSSSSADTPLTPYM